MNSQEDVDVGINFSKHTSTDLTPDRSSTTPPPSVKLQDTESVSGAERAPAACVLMSDSMSSLSDTLRSSGRSTTDNSLALRESHDSLYSSLYEAGAYVTPQLARAMRARRQAIRDHYRPRLAREYEERQKIRELCHKSLLTEKQRNSIPLHMDVELDDDAFVATLFSSDYLNVLNVCDECSFDSFTPPDDLFEGSLDASYDPTDELQRFDEHFELSDLNQIFSEVLEHPMLDGISFVPHGNEKIVRREDWKKKEKLEKRLKIKRQNVEAKLAKTVQTKQKSNKTRIDVPHAADTFSFDADSIRKMFDMLDSSALSSYGLGLDDNVTSSIENLVLLFGCLMKATDEAQAIGIVLMYVKTHFKNRSFCKTASDFIKSFLFTEYEPHSSNAENFDWLSMMRSYMTNWKLFSTHTMFRKFSYLCSCLITLGLCDKSSFNWSVAGMKIFCVEALEKHVSAFDLFGAIAETVVYFVEAGHACFTTGSLKPLLYSDQRMREFDVDYTMLVSNIDNVQTGNLQRTLNMDENEFSYILEKALKTAVDLVDVANSPWERKIFTDKLTKLRQVHSTFSLVRVQGGLRIAPFCVCLYGGSGVGKSSLSALTMVIGLHSNGFRATDDVMISVNTADKFMSNMRSNVMGIYFDDMNNTKAQFVTGAPSAQVIECVNNVRQQANMAEANQKGKVSIEPRWVNITTNTKDFGATVFSNEPFSIVRRANYTVTVSVKERFCTGTLVGCAGQMMDSEKVADFYGGPEFIPPVADVWKLTVQRPVEIKSQSPGGKSSIGYETVHHNGCPLEDVDVWTYIDFIICESKKHFVAQKALVERSANMVKKIEFCDECRAPVETCKCVFCCHCKKNVVHCECVPDDVSSVSEEDASVMEPHAATYVLGTVGGYLANKAISRCYNAVSERFVREEAIFDNWATRKLVEASFDLEKSQFVQWTNWIPNDWLVHAWGKNAVLYAMKDEVASQVSVLFWQYQLLSLFVLLYGAFFGIYWLFWFLIPLQLRLVFQMRVASEVLYQRILERNDSMPEVAKIARDQAVRYVLVALGGAAVLYFLADFWRGLRNCNILPQGNLFPCSQSDIEQRDAETSPWRGKVPTRELPTSQVQRTIVPTDLVNVAYKNLCYMEIKRPDRLSGCDAFFPCSNIAIIPQHMWCVNGSDIPDSEMDVTFYHTDGHNFRCLLGFAHSYNIPKTDLCVVWVPGAGEWRDIRKFLPLERGADGPALVVHRARNGDRHDDAVLVTHKAVGHTRMQWDGIDLVYNRKVFGGLCMAPIISNTKVPTIVGFHLGGKPESNLGCGGIINQTQLDDALSHLVTLEGVLLSHSMGDFPTKLFDKQVLSSKEVHDKCPLNYMPAGCVVPYGSVLERSRAISSVVTLPISEAVEDVYGVPKKHGPPRMSPSWAIYRDNLLHVQNVSPGIPAHLLDLAVRDYLISILPVLDVKGTRKYLRVLSNDECLSGIDGVRFIDSLVLSTSAGFPFGGPKEQFFQRLPPNETHQAPLILDSKFWDLIAECEAMYLDGKRCHFIFKSCLKDEPTKLTSEKTRVFQGAPLALSIMIRKYFLPIARVLSMHPLTSECAVGINCQGPEWQQLVNHIRTFGTERILAGDYSKYDLRMPAQLILAAFKVLITIAEKSGRYDVSDLVVMRGLATDVAYSVTAFDGTLVQTVGSNPSGHNLTVYINSIVNSLLFRAAYYELEPFPTHFQSDCKLSTYGDDAWSSVSPRCKRLNHLTFAAFLSRYDMVFTMPDKTSEPTAFMKFEDVDFLKRRSVYHPKLDIEFGALDEESIFKSLHTVVRSKAISLAEQSVANMEGALREWFFHGENIYEDRRHKMTVLASLTNLPVRGMHSTYDELCEKWCEDYDWSPSVSPGKAL